MNIDVQVCGLVNTIVLFLFYISHRRLKLYKSRIFFHVLLITLINISLDIFSVIAIANKAVWDESVVLFFCRIYLCAVIAENWGALTYVTSDCFPEKKHRFFSTVMALISVAECFLIFIFPIHIYANGNVVYTYGGSVQTLYCVAAIDIIATLLCTFIFSKRMNSRRKFGVRVWMGIWLSAMLLQGLNNELLVVGYAASLGMIVLFISLENPEGQLDKEYGTLNTAAFSEYVNQCLARKTPYAAYNISLENAYDYKGQSKRAKDNLKEVFEFFKSYPKVHVFKDFDLNLILVSRKTALLDQAVEDFLNYFCRRISNEPMIFISHLPDGSRLKAMEDILHLFQYIKKNNLEVFDTEIIQITPVDIERFYMSEKLRQEITTALADDRVEIFLQPIYDTVQKKIRSAEALVRIRKADGALLSPGLFIPVAEETGQIVELGRRVFEKTCEFLANSEATSLGIDYIEVNLSVVQAESATLCENVMRLIEKYGISPSQINLEITETASIKSKRIIQKNMEQLIAKGITFALDDFGKGESNLMYIMEMPFQILKLDMDMTKAYFSNPKAPSIMKAIKQLASDLQLKLVVEGVERKEELDEFMKYEVDHIQGYYFSRPLPTNEFLTYLKEFNTI